MTVAHGGSPASLADPASYADLVLVALADAGRQFPIPLEAFGELIDGCEADVRGTSYPTFDDLRVYCRCVAGSIGRLSLGVFGTRDVATAAPLADALGVALQLTNILRDIREDYQDGRVYLPDEDFKRFGAELPPDRSGWPAADPKLVDLVAFEAERARDWYARGLRLMPMLDRRSAACTGAMAGIYYRLLQSIAAAPQLVLQRRVSLSPGQKAMVAVRSLAGAALRSGRSGPPAVHDDRGSAPMSPDPLSPAPASPGQAGAGPDRPGRHVVVVGGGLAGITAAIALRETGARVTLLESRPRLGGATCSFTRGGLVVDNGQHVFLGCCTAYRELIARLGMTGSVSLQDRFDVAVLGPHGRARLRRTRLPGPLHMGQALVTYPLLSPAERLRVTRAALAMRFLDPARPGLDAQRLGDWLAAHGQSERARRVLWDLFTVSALNVAGDDANLSLAATVVRTALLGARDAADIGTPAIPLGDLHGQAAARLLGQLGASVRLGAKVTSVQPLDGGGFRVRLADRGVSAAPPGTKPPDTKPPGTKSLSTDLAAVDGVVLAVPPEAAARLLPAGAAAPGPGPERWRELGASPIVNVHVLYDRQVTSLPFAAAVDSPVQWVFDRTGPSGLDAGQYLAVSVSAADDVVDTPAAQLRERFVPALEEIFPAARDARITDFFVTRERRATFRQEPGCGEKRPGATTRLPGLVLAGAWTNTGWPDTMEGAVRSGLSAARELRREMTQSRHGVSVATRAAEVAGAAS